MLEILRIIAGSILALFIPGFVWTLALFKDKITNVERIVLSFAISATFVPLTIYLSSLLGMPVTLVNSLVVIAILTCIPIIILLIRI